MRDATNGVGMSMNDLFAGANSPNFGAVNIDYSRAVTRLQTLNIEAEAIQSLLSRVLPRGTASPSTASRKDSTVSTICFLQLFKMSMETPPLEKDPANDCGGCKDGQEGFMMYRNILPFHCCFVVNVLLY